MLRENSLLGRRRNAGELPAGVEHVPAEVLVVPNFQTIKFLSLDNTRTAIMLPYIASAFGTFLMRQTFKQVPRHLEEASVIDGCHPLQTLWHVFIPVARPTLAAFALTSISFHWNNFFWPLIATNTNDKRPLTVGLAMFTKAAESGADWSLITAGTTMVGCTPSDRLLPVPTTVHQ